MDLDLRTDFASRSEVVKQRLQGGGYGLSTGPSMYDHTIDSWATAGRGDDGAWYRYYLVKVTSMLRTFVAGTFKINGYNYVLCRPVDDSHNLIPGTQLSPFGPTMEKDQPYGFNVADDSFGQTNALNSIGPLALFRVPSHPGDTSTNSLAINFSVTVEDHDNNGSGYYDRTENALRPFLGDVQLTKFDDRGCTLTFPPIWFELDLPVP